jgi:superfamily I DNA/RNA helicase
VDGPNDENEDSLVPLSFDWGPSDKSLKDPSSEQQAVVDAIATGTTNVCVNAVAGSGKTTTLLHVAKALPERCMLVLTYNKRLKDATRAAITRHGLKSTIEAHSFHATAASYYRGAANFSTDDGLKKLVQRDPPPSRKLKFDLLIIDEAQDLKPLTYQFVLKLMRDRNLDSSNTRPLQVLLLGDERQMIYAFMGADGRYLTLCEQTFPNALPWKTLTLRTSYRATVNTAEFVNKILFGYTLINASAAAKEGPKVQYLTGNPWEAVAYMYGEIQQGIRHGALIFAVLESLVNESKSTLLRMFRH